MDNAFSRKKAVRERILARRSALDAADGARRSAAICAAVETIAEYTGAGSISFYMPIRGEVDISPLMRNALLRGALCALPRCAEGRTLRFFAVADPRRDVAPGCLGIPEPKECLNECNASVFSVIMVPGVAFDRQGFRIGYGAGYYDRLLAGSGRGALKIAPAYSFQVLDALPSMAHDVPVDIIVTEDEIIDCRRAGGDTNG